MAFCLLVSVCAASQSLGDLARKERERREKNKDSGVSAREFSEDEIFEDEDEEQSENEEEGIEAESDADTGDADAPPLPDRIDIEVEGDRAEALDAESRDRNQDEAEWRTRFADARARVSHAREQKAIWDGVHYVEGIKLVDENGNVLVRSLEDLRRFVDEANEEVTAAEQALRTLEEQARRAGVPPGWRR